MIDTDMSLRRTSIERLAHNLTEMLEGVPDSRARRQLADCAIRISAVARSMPGEGLIPLSRRQPVLAAARHASDTLGQLQRSSVIMLGILLSAPGVTHSTRTLAASMGVSVQSVRVFAFYLRKWLQENGHPNAVGSQWGQGYAIDPASAMALIAGRAELRELVQMISGQEEGELRQAA